MTTKKRPESGGTETRAKKTARSGTRPGEAGPRRAPRTATARPGARPRIHASHATPPIRQEGAQRPKARVEAAGAEPESDLIPSLKASSPPAKPRRALGGPKRAGKPRAQAETAAPTPSSAARELAVSLAASALDKKAIGVEILDVTGKVDYADFLVVMTGRSDRHVHAIATGIEEAMRKRRLAPLSVEGLTGATWVLIDFGDVVVHVFQEEARALYDIEGLWIDAGRVPVPAVEGHAGQDGGSPRTPGPG